MALTPSNPFPLHTIAPEFSLEDSVTGKTFNLQQLKGKQATVIMFICNHCPFVIHVNSKLVELANQFKSQGVNFIAISSNDVENYPQDAPDKMKEVAAENKYPFPYLYDPIQDVAKAYDAACTPDFYVFDKDLKSTYHGRLDDSRPGNDKPLTGKDLIAAINATLNNDTPLKNQLPSMGCNIKWK
ncbi:peroxiredoxin [Mesoflavibacter sabulilitoris]|uniref:Thioredoxin family protein n=1 Tax=Mesoflavibacter zeaxanthinifaciens subsp. sabulilitoris TaxID=1520893 RepID=A0A2T1NBH2_9FLAO|nr:thioredoxin family protein [Mesoflavibacter zeaxanthinifaciens]MBB3125101.1 peroxiredoxin [Mesoflavibacter zeaxanthinifaciens subsp. sabulilitoris]PSG89781.1 thioredoxin family protein [Mesoflavibacter zeaxanthinifaciens subsp. sabulilitoris]